MDAFPSVPGQLLVVPRQPIDYLFAVPDELYTHLWRVAKQLVPALDQVFDTSRTCVVVEGFEVPHVHIKLYPLPASATNLTDYLAHTGPADSEELAAHLTNIKTALEALNIETGAEQ